MKPEEAIKAIKGLENIIEYWTCRPDEVVTAKLAIEALEKQIPKKPGWDGPHNEAKDDAIPYCSICDSELEEDWDGCPYCLQKIDWSVGE